MSEYEFACTDAAGASHHYTCTRHRGSEGMTIALKLSALFVEPLTAAAGPAIVQAVGDKGVKSISDLDLEGLDFGKIGATLRMALASVPPALLWAILRYCNRDGEPMMDNAGKPTGHFDKAYAGNYLEMGRAVWEVCRINAFFPGLDTLASVGAKAMSAMQETPEKNA